MSRGTSTWTLDNFGAGEDLREGVFAQDQNRFKELENIRTTPAKRLQRRPPCIKAAGAFDSSSAGMFLLGGLLYTIGKKGTTPALPTGVTAAKLFDAPDHTTTWTLIDAVTFNGHLCALIRHTFPGTVVTSRLFLHVWDGSTSKPTYVEDPFCPTNWGPTFPLHLYGKGSAGAFTDYTPRMWVVGSRLCISRPDGQVGFSKVANPRAWNTRTVDEFKEGGEWWYFITTTTSGVQEFIVSDRFADLLDVKKWAGYVMEYLDATGTWVELTEDNGGPTTTHAHWAPVTVASRFGGDAEIKARVYWTAGADTILRLRLCLLPAVAVTGATWDVTQYSRSFNGNGVTTTFAGDAEFGGTGWVYLSGVLKTNGVDYTVTSTAPFTVNFGVAPPAGAGNVVLVKGPRTTQVIPNSYSYQGVVSGTNPLTGIVQLELPFAASTEKMFGFDARSAYPGTVSAIVLNITTGNIEFPSGTATGQIRLHTLWTVLAKTGSSATFPEPFESKTAPYSYTNSQFYIDHLLNYQLNLAGADDAGFLPTASQNQFGGLVTLLCGVKNRLLVAYANGSALWNLPSNPAEAERLDVSPLGTGNQTDPQGVLFEGVLMVPLAAGLWGVSLGTDLSDKMNAGRLGDAIEPGGLPVLQAVTYWPWLGEYVAAQATAGVFFFRVFDYNRETKVAAWEKWKVRSVASVVPRTMVALNDRLYFRSGNDLYYFDASVYTIAAPVPDGTYRDTNDLPGAGNAYLSRAVWHHNDFKKPGTNKRLLFIDLAQDGVVRTKFRTVAYDETQEVDGPQIDGTTYGKSRFGLSMNVQSVGLILESTDETGWLLERAGIDFSHARR